MKKFLATALAVLMTFSVTACGSSEKNTQSEKENTTAPKATEAFSDSESQKTTVTTEQKPEDLLPKTELENKEVVFFSHYPLNPTENDLPRPELDMFKEVYGGYVTDLSTTWERRYDNLTELIVSGQSPDFFSGSDMDAFPMGAIRKMFQPIDGYIDYNSPLWADVSDSADSFAVKDKHYAAVIDVLPMYVCYYSKDMIAEYGLEDPSELFSKGEWTLDKFFESCNTIAQPYFDDEYRYVDWKSSGDICGWWYPEALSNTTGKTILSLDEDGKLVTDFESPEFAYVEDEIYTLYRRYLYETEDLFDFCGYDEDSDAFSYDYDSCFFPCGLFTVEGKDKAKAVENITSGKVGFVPMPMSTFEGNTTYYTPANIDGYFLCEGAKNPDGFSALMNCMRVCATDEKTVKSLDESRKELFGWDDSMVEMYHTMKDMALENPVFELSTGYTFEFRQIYSQDIIGPTSWHDAMNDKKWSDVVNEQKGAIEYLINEGNTVLSENF